jgi:NAD(P)-dependent dehydrogenase (short-subunit alcohol dehydrogenase family)
MNKQIAVVTGSSSGFGQFTSLEFAKRGFRVIATMRNTQKSTEILNQAKLLGLEELIHIQELDVTSADSIQSWKQFMEKLGRIDVLVNNAGYAAAGFVEEIPIDEYRKQFETNVFGVIAVTQAILPMMRQQGMGKIINMSSISGRIGFPGLSPYIASKHALEGWSESLRLEMKPFGIDVVLVEPGSYETNIWSTGKHVTEKSLQSDSPYFKEMQKIENHLNKAASKYGNPEDVARLIVSLTHKKSPPLRFPIGKGVKVGIVLKNTLPWKYWERMFFDRLS